MGDKCTIVDGVHIEPCDSLARNTDNWNAGFSRAKGLARWHYTNIRTRKPARTFFGAKTGDSPNGLAFNYCPWCGEAISAPFDDQASPADEPLPTVAVHFDEHGEIDYFVSGEGIRLIIVDDRTPHDRIYEWLPRASAETMAALIPAGADIGSNQDDRHSAAAHMINSALRGEPHLSIVPTEDHP